MMIFFNNYDLKPEDREYLNSLLQKSNFADVGTTSPRNESRDLKYEDVFFPASDIEQQMNLSDGEKLFITIMTLIYLTLKQLTILLILSFYKKDLYILGID